MQVQQQEPITWHGEELQHIIDRPRFGLKDPEYRDYIANHCLGLAPGMQVADIGCGTAASSLTLVPYLLPGGMLTGFDRDPEVLVSAQANAARQNVTNVGFDCADAASIPVPDDTFDVSMCQTVLMHVEDPEAVLLEMKRITRPGGVVAATEPDFQNASVTHVTGPPRAAIDAGLWAYATALYMEGGRIRRAGDWAIGFKIAEMMHELGFEKVRARVAPASWFVGPRSDGRPATALLKWAVDLFYPEPGSTLYEMQHENFRVAGGPEPLWEDFVALRARERNEIYRAHERSHAVLRVYAAGFLSTGRVPEEPSL